MVQRDIDSVKRGRTEAEFSYNLIGEFSKTLEFTKFGVSEAMKASSWEAGSKLVSKEP